jgi:hypothetical protein
MRLSEIVGVTHHVQTTLATAAFGYALTNPTFVITGVVVAWVAKFSANKYTEKMALNEI